MKIYAFKSLLLMFGVIFAMAACSASSKPFDYQPDNELKPGPGLFSGEKGKFIIFRSPEMTDPEEDLSRKVQKGGARMKAIKLAFKFLIFELSLVSYVQPKDLIACPAQGQSNDQMEKEKFECYNWTKGQTGFNSMQMPTATSTPPSQEKRGVGGSTVAGGILGGAGGNDRSYCLNLQKAGRLADFLEFGELMTIDALDRKESCGGYLREESQSEDGEAVRDDTNFCYVSAWQYRGDGVYPELYKEPLVLENVELAQRSYK